NPSANSPRTVSRNRRAEAAREAETCSICVNPGNAAIVSACKPKRKRARSETRQAYSRSGAVAYECRPRGAQRLAQLAQDTLHWPVVAQLSHHFDYARGGILDLFFSGIPSQAKTHGRLLQLPRSADCFEDVASRRAVRPACRSRAYRQ